MEVPPKTQKNTLRVLRFHFDANEQLRDQVAQNITEKFRYSTQMSFYASRQLLLPIEEALSHEEELHILGKQFKEHAQPIVILPKIQSRRIDERLTRFRFLPQEQADFDAMTEIDEYPLPSRFHDETLRQPEKIENLLHDQPKTGHYLFVDIASRVLIDEHLRREQQALFTKNARKGRFWLRPHQLHIVRDITYTTES